MKKVFLLIFCISLSGLFVYLIINRNNDNSKSTSFYFDRGTTHAYESQTDNGKVLIGKKETNGQVKSEVTFQKWEGEAEMKISYPTSNIQPVTEGSTVTWKDEDKEVFFKKIVAGETSTPTPTRVIDNGQIRYIPYGSTDLQTMVTAYSLPTKNNSMTPTLMTFVPNQDGYAFFGNRNASSDLKDLEMNRYPIARFNPTVKFTCPVIPTLKNGTITATFYYPKIEERSDEFIDYMTQAINESLKDAGVTTEVQRKADSLFIMNGIRPVALGRIVTDKTNLTFYLYLENPYNTPLKNNLRTRVLAQDTILLPYGDLKDLKPDISVDILQTITTKFAEKATAQF